MRSDIGYVMPFSAHDGHAQAPIDARHTALDSAFHDFSKRFKGRRTQPHALPTAAWVNQSSSDTVPDKTPNSHAVN
jgi:hypothetical protein